MGNNQQKQDRKTHMIRQQRQPKIWIGMLLCFAAIGLFSAFFLNIFRSIFSDLREQGTVAPVIEIRKMPKDAQIPSLPEEVKSDDAIAGESDEPAVIDVDWSQEDLIQKAALLLIENQRYNQAAALLQHHEGTRDEALLFARRLRDRLVEQFKEAVLQEKEKLKENADLNSAQIDSGDFATGLPLPTAYVFAANVKTRLKKEDSGLPEPLIRSLFRDMLSENLLVYKLLEKQDVVDILSYVEAEAHFQRQLNEKILVPRVRSVLILFQNKLHRGDDRFNEWFSTVTGMEFTEELRGLKLDTCDELVLRLLWRKLPTVARALWREAILKEDGKLDVSILPVATQEEIFWLRVSREPSIAQLQNWVCLHPAWQDCLHEFDYLAALHRLPLILEDIGAERYLTTLNRQLSGSLQEEKRCFEKDGFDWNVFRKRLGIEGRRPPNLDPYKRPSNEEVDDEWARISFADMYAALEYLGRIASNFEERSFYNSLASLFARNRGMTVNQD